MKTVAIIQARMGSTRLPGKIALELGGKSMLERVVERASAIEGVDQVVVATSTLPADDRVVALAKLAGVPCSRGSEDDVLSRYHAAAKEHAADEVIRITADCPLLDPAVSSRVVVAYREEAPDYASNVLERTFPRGLDTEILGFDVLDRAFYQASDKSDREHVTLYVWRQPEMFDLLSVVGEVDHNSHGWTVDTPWDYEFVQKVYSELGGGAFHMKEVLDLLEQRPDLLELNAHVEQKKH